MKSSFALLHVALLLTAGTASAASLTFTLDPAGSVIQASAMGGGAIATAQQPGVSNRAPWSGTLQVTVDNLAAPTQIQVTGGSLAPANTGSWQPQSGGAAGAAPASYGLSATSGITVLFATRGVSAQVAQPAPVALTPSADGFSFPAAGGVAVVGTVDYRPSGVFQPGASALDGPAANQPWDSGTLVLSGGRAQLRLPVQVTRTFSAGVAASLSLGGMLTADVLLTAPTVKISGRKVRNVTASRLNLRGTVSDSEDDIVRVEVRLGSKKFKPARGTSAWRYSLRGLRPGRNVVRVRAFDSAGLASAAAKLIVIRR